MSNDLVERLRDYGDTPQDVSDGEWAEWSHKAADEITRLREQLAEAQNQLDSALHTNAAWEKRAEEFARQRDAARAEALEEGLKRAAKDRATFCTAMVGTDEEFRAYLDGFDAAIRALIKEDRK